jgi:hypothetical protein
LVAIEFQLGRTVVALKSCTARAAGVRHSGGSVAGLDASVRWLDQVIRTHPGLADSAAKGLKAELLRLGDGVRGGG